VVPLFPILVRGYIFILMGAEILHRRGGFTDVQFSIRGKEHCLIDIR